MQDSIQSFVYYSINQYGNIFVRSVELVILNSKSKSSIVYTFISIHIRIFLLNTHKSNSNNEFHLHFIPFFECLFKSVGYDTINYNPVHSLDCLYSIVSNLASDLSGITHFYFEHWNKLDSVRLFLPFPNNSIFSFLTPIPQRIETCYLERFGFGVMGMRQWMIEC